jgi:hypothetical protein
VEAGQATAQADLDDEYQNFHEHAAYGDGGPDQIRCRDMVKLAESIASSFELTLVQENKFKNNSAPYEY